LIDRRSLMLTGLAATALAPLPAWADPTQGWVDVREFGAKGDGARSIRPAINRAIDHAAERGGGTVYFPRERTPATPSA
jgi:polygalacturonase